MIINNLNQAYPLKTNFKASLLANMMKNSAVEPQQQQDNLTQQKTNPAFVPISTPIAEDYNKFATGSLLTMMLNKAQKTTTPVAAITTKPEDKPLENYKNNLRSMFQNRQAVIYAMIPRTFNAQDTDGNGLIEGNETPGYFTNMVDRLDELKTYGINTLHILPINPPGKIAAKGSAGSVYAPDDYLQIDPKLDDPNNPKSVYEEFKDAIKECHKRNIKVMIDLPSCMSVDFYNRRPDLRATDAEGNPKTPEGWEDIRMFNVWQDADKRILNPALVDYHKKFVDMCLDLGIDGIRADVARAKPPEFWDVIIPYARSKDPEFGMLAESYTYEDASPMKNMPADRPEECLQAGFDTYYGQYHIFNIWKAKDFHEFVTDNLKMSQKYEKGKSIIGSFATHDDKSPMSSGGPEYCMMTNVIQTTLPMTNPYMVTGYESGDEYIYPYGKKFVNRTFAQLLENPVYKDTIDSLLKTEQFENREQLRKLVNSTDVNKKVADLAKDENYKGVIDFLSDFSLTKDNIKHYVHTEFVDIFNESRKPGGDHPEIGQHFGYLMNSVRTNPKYTDLITKGDYIPLDVENNSRDEVIAYANYKDGKALVTIANKDVNSSQKVKVKVPGMAANQELKDLSPKYGKGSSWSAKQNEIEIDLGPAQAHIFEIDAPNIEKLVKPEQIFKQNV